MKPLCKLFPTISLALLLAVACSSTGTSSGASSPAAGSGAAPVDQRSRTGSGVLDLASMLTGTFEGTTPGNSLNVIVTGTIASGTVYNLPIRVTGTYGNEGVRQQGVMHLENQGRGVSLQYIPHFDPTVGVMTADQLQFAPRELEAACNFDVTPRGDGFFGETTGSSTCARAIHGAVGKWSFEVEPGSVRIRNAETGETLRFKRVSK